MRTYGSGIDPDEVVNVTPGRIPPGGTGVHGGASLSSGSGDLRTGSGR
jgi:hypothetical protein